MFYISFLKEFKDWNGLTVNEKIVYSLLANYSVMCQNAWYKVRESECGENRLNMDKIKDMIKIHDWFELAKISNKKISEKTGISLRTVSTILNRLKDLKILEECDEQVDFVYYAIQVPEGLIDNGYLDLPKNTGLKGMQLIFWAFINQRLGHYNERTGNFYNKSLDTWASRLATDMGVKKKDIQNYIHCLTKRGFLKRSEDGKYLVLYENGDANVKNEPTKFNTTTQWKQYDEDLPF